MVDRLLVVSRLSVDWKRFVRVVETLAHRTAGHQAASKPDSSEGFESVGVLEDLGLDALAFDTG
jgi:hypothetical protein